MHHNTALRRHSLVGLALALVGTVGCGQSAPSEQLESARAAVQTALSAWKKGDRADSLRSLSPPIEFAEDNWKIGLRLLDYQVTSVESSPEQIARCAVTLSIKDKRGKVSEREVVYMIANKSGKMVIARDPYN